MRSPSRQQRHEFTLEFLRVVTNVFACMFSDDQHLPQVRLAVGVTLEPVLVSALFLANLAVPSQSLQPLGFHCIGDGLWGAGCRLTKFGP